MRSTNPSYIKAAAYNAGPFVWLLVVIIGVLATGALGFDVAARLKSSLVDPLVHLFRG